MRVLRGRAGSVEADRARTEELRRHASAEREPAFRVWRPHRRVAFGRRDAAADGYERARRLARERGYPPIERSVGGRAVACQGSTVAFVRAEPIADPRSGLRERYERATAAVEAALERVGVEPQRDEPGDAFCPGSHALSAAGGKVVGLAQRVTSDVALVGGVAIPRDRWPIAEVLEVVYDALDVPFDPGSVGSVGAAGGDPDPDALIEALEAELLGDREPAVEEVG